MDQTCDVLAIYPFPEAPRPCHIVEILVKGSDGDFPIFDFTQERPGMAEVDWQIPHCAKIMSAGGYIDELAPANADEDTTIDANLCNHGVA